MICPDYVVTKAKPEHVGGSKLRESELAAEVGAAGRVPSLKWIRARAE
jgi:hypothetical protein